MTNTQPTIIDLFSGCGGFGLGAELAGFHTLVAIDKDPTLQSSYRLNFPHTKAIVADITALNRKFWRDQLGDKRPTGVIGGPPCQGFSRIGKRNIDDERNNLIDAFFDQVVLLQPDFFVMENVAGLLDDCFSDQLAKTLQRIRKHYDVLSPQLIVASDFGVPSTRRRVVIVGTRIDLGIEITESDLIPSQPQRVTVAQAISDLPAPYGKRGARDTFDWGSYSSIQPDFLSPYAKLLRAHPQEGLGWETAVKQLSKGKVSGNLSTKHTNAVIGRFKKTECGKTEAISRYPRLDPYALCPTLRAGTGADRGSYQSMRPIHPTSPRVITAREAARLQSFPDWFVFHPTKWHSFRMIGNSVPPLVSKEILSKMMLKLELQSAASTASKPKTVRKQNGEQNTKSRHIA